MASHRKPRASRTLQTLHAHSPAVGVTTAAALASVTLLSSQSATAATGASGDQERTPTVEEVQRKVDDLYRQAGTATWTPRYGKSGEAAQQRRREAGGTTAGDAARRTEAADGARRALAGRTAAPHRAEGPGPVAPEPFADAPHARVDPAPLMEPVPLAAHEPLVTPEPLTAHEPLVAEPRAERTGGTVTDLGTRRAAPAGEREALGVSQTSLRATKRTAQRKLGEARALLEDARRRAEAVERPPREHRPPEQHPYRRGDDRSRSTATKAREVLAFAEAQMGKPYVWGATGPSSYDCAGLTQAAWRAAGVDLPRSAREQAYAGTPVAPEDLRPGDLVFFHADAGHVGIYTGDGRMIHAPGPGEDVREESLTHLPLHSGVRPG
ncbi:glycoside hydrolase [Streptomyces lavendofoliae]|uniref:Glycoside hydrolase n=1 Tax=Streptomyces lavendofoliae TaxID=67314 RepID=A0A918HVY9_9ACTN|nr:glycoside hydrolase [Streptomyces lavendofoliae]